MAGSRSGICCRHIALCFPGLSQCCSWYGKKDRSEHQRKCLKSFVEQQSGLSSPAFLRPRLPSERRRVTRLSATQLCLTVSGVTFISPLAFRILDYGNTIPDDLLRPPFTSVKDIVVRSICKPVWLLKEEKRLRCNRQLLHQALLECISSSAERQFDLLVQGQWMAMPPST